MLALLAAAAAGCSELPIVPVDPFPGAFTVDSATYTAQPIGTEQVGFRLVARYHNPTNAPIYLDRCSPTAPHPLFAVNLQSTSFTTESGYNMGFACVGHDQPIVVGPGETRTDTLRITGPNVFDNASQHFLGAVAGTFSLSYFASACRPASTSCSVPPGPVPTRSVFFDVKLTAAGIIPAITRDLSAAIQTDSLIYHVRTVAGFYESTFRVTLFNATADTIYMPSCDGRPLSSLEKKVGVEWKAVLTELPPSCPSPLPVIVVAPRAHYEWGTPLHSVPAAVTNMEPRFADAEIGGTYRLTFSGMYNHYAGPATGVSVPVELRRSNVFVMVPEF
jgi:hypothetical protein